VTYHIWWHGTPDTTFASAEIAARDSMFRAVFLTKSPAVAAFYAGPEGIVHGFRCKDNARLLDVSKTTIPRLMTAEEVALLDEACKQHFDGGFQKWFSGFGLSDTLCWNEALLILGSKPELGAKVLLEMGFHGFLRSEAVSWALGDRYRRGAASIFGDLVRNLCAQASCNHMVLAVLDPADLVPDFALSSTDICHLLAEGDLQEDLDTPASVTVPSKPYNRNVGGL
jgi:hypothetical protein